jgi:hypothetical protein
VKPFVSVDTLSGYVALWASRQSPYHAPDGLVEVLREFHNRTLAHRMTGEEAIDSWPCVLATGDNLRTIVEQCLLSQPQVLLWNERKNGNRSPFQFVSRYDGPRNPDDDFIDLDALRINIVSSCLDDARVDRSDTVAVAAPLPQTPTP